MRFFAWLESTWLAGVIKWLALAGLGCVSPANRLMEMLLSPYFHFENPTEWAEQIQKLPIDTIGLKLLPAVLVCVALNCVYLACCRKLLGRFAHHLKQRLMVTETPSA
ncbi:MAG TPA: hypothetical protein V6C99_12515 [Oculatellaceae cyanobacterium]